MCVVAPAYEWFAVARIITGAGIMGTTITAFVLCECTDNGVTFFKKTSSFLDHVGSLWDFTQSCKMPNKSCTILLQERRTNGKRVAKTATYCHIVPDHI